MAVPLLVITKVASPAFDVQTPITERLVGGVTQVVISATAVRVPSSGLVNV